MPAPLIVSNFASACRRAGALLDCARGLESTGGDDAPTAGLEFVYYPDSLWPRHVFDVQLPAGVEAEAIDHLAARMRAGELPPLWVTTPLDTPGDSSHRAQARGFGLVRSWHGMARAGAAAVARPGVELVQNPADEIDWARLVVAYLYEAQSRFDAAQVAVFEQRFVALVHRLRTSGEFYFYLARVDGQAAAAATLFLDERAAGIFHVATHPDFRRRGLATAITEHAARAGHEHGREWTVLHASDQGLPVYETMGFRKYLELDLLRPAP